MRQWLDDEGRDVLQAVDEERGKRGVDDKVAFNHLIRGHAKEGKPRSAFEILSIMTRRRVESDADAELLEEGRAIGCKDGAGWHDGARACWKERLLQRNLTMDCQGSSR